MYMAQQPMRAARSYATIDTGSRVEGASPHQLVRVLFDELLLSMDTAALSLKMGDRHRSLERQTRALAILHALESSLDFEQGGEIAISLATIYREVRRRMLEATASNDHEAMTMARGYIGEIADAWSQIG